MHACMHACRKRRKEWNIIIIIIRKKKKKKKEEEEGGWKLMVFEKDRRRGERYKERNEGHGYEMSLHISSVCERRTCNPPSHAHATPRKQTNPNSQHHLPPFSFISLFFSSNTEREI